MNNNDNLSRLPKTEEEAELYAEKCRLEQYRINTGTIFLNLERQWRKYDREFLKNIFQEAVESTLINKKIVTAKYDGTNAEYLENYRESRYPSALKFSEDINNFPFPSIFLIPDKDSIYSNFVDYGESCFIQRSDYCFDLFFAMQYSLEDIVEGEERKAEEFLEYHLEHTFENDLPMYKDFINSICIKYKEFLNDKYVPLAAHFFEKITYNPAKGEKLTWLGSPSQFGYIFSQLANLGFIKFPLTNGEISCSKFAKVCWGLFDLEVGTTLENLQKEMNPNKNTLSDTMRSKFSIPSLSEFSSKKKKPIS